ncbi:MAG TPA: DNA polymerase III subunit [Syntrophorhabdaceae bacterium]|nr:DNA polymerase III subunit [Syntrophorhabdaceae bacterium]HOL05507.1 DNA polymerase III subunit [Syntrophorhabdaceae bacterium]HON85452.1 DNA polymerase III subunit [Syntrophorhabdaceae bacterium]HOT41427.1 DNA polymerase III subunit [Syntrophorhabdaceae bacterium]HQE79800.1 DNA polymerase III subunit [Syntrophorhabdaceae bacterium]
MNYTGFDDIIGHDRPKHIISAFLERERMPHAFLFSGQEGIGKKKMAIAVARRILCDTGKGCGVCRGCTRVSRMTHPDLILLDRQHMEWAAQPQQKKAQNDNTEKTREINTISIDFIRGSEDKKIRGINQEVHKYPYEGKKRVIIIDDADNMTTEATNAFLKTLEEPPEFNLFFLITSRESDLPITIRSRCTRVSFCPLSQAQLRQYFIDKLGIEKERARLLSYISNGSINTGLFWLEGDNLNIRKRLGEFVLGRTKGFVEATFLGEYISRGGRELSIYISFLFSLFRDLYLIKKIKTRQGIINMDFVELLERARYSMEAIDRGIQKIKETAGIMRYNINKWLMFENLILQLKR